MDVAGEYLLYYEGMTRVYLADGKLEERSALRLLLLDLKMKVVGEASDWTTTLAQVPVSRIDILLVEWDLLPNAPGTALVELRTACPIRAGHRSHQPSGRTSPSSTFRGRGRFYQ